MDDDDHDGHDHGGHNGDDDNYGLGFGLVFAAGIAMAIGAAGIFVPGMSTAPKSMAWAAALAVSAGLLVFLAMVEFSEESIEEFAAAGNEDGIEFLYFGMSFFGGVLGMFIFERAIHTCMPHDCHDHDDGAHASFEKSNGAPLVEAGQASDHVHENDAGSNPGPALTIKTAFAVAFHNIPEGLVIFVSAVADDKGADHLPYCACTLPPCSAPSLPPSSCFRPSRTPYCHAGFVRRLP